MRVRFSKNDVVDTKTLADLAADYEDGNIPSTGDTPILEVDLSAEEVGYIKKFVSFCSYLQGEYDSFEFASSAVSETENIVLANAFNQ